MSRGLLSLRDIPAGGDVFIDANIFIYHFTGNSLECTDFLSRCEEGELKGATSSLVLAEVLHRLMLAEASFKRLLKGPKMAEKIRRKPEIVSRLMEYSAASQAVHGMKIKVCSLTEEIVLTSQDIRFKYGLMVNDSLIAATMRDEGFLELATNDDGFSRVDWIRVYKPDDLPT